MTTDLLRWLTEWGPGRLAMAVSHWRQSEAENPRAAQKCWGFKSQAFPVWCWRPQGFLLCIANLCVRSLTKLVLTPTKGYHSSKTEGLSSEKEANKQKVVSSTTSFHLGWHHLSGGSLCSNNQIKKIPGRQAQRLVFSWFYIWSRWQPGQTITMTNCLTQ